MDNILFPCDINHDTFKSTSFNLSVIVAYSPSALVSRHECWGMNADFTTSVSGKVTMPYITADWNQKYCCILSNQSPVHNQCKRGSSKWNEFRPSSQCAYIYPNLLARTFFWAKSSMWMTENAQKLDMTVIQRPNIIALNSEHKINICDLHKRL